MRDIRKDFPVATHHLYFDTPSTGALSEPLMEWRNEHDIDFLIGGSSFREKHHRLIETIREKTARFLGADVANTALIPNFSFGFNALMDGIEKPQKALLLQGDYPSITWPVIHRKFDVCYAEINENVEQNIWETAKKYRPDLFVFSLVQYVSGIKIDLDFLHELKKEFPEMLLVGDGTQFIGTEVFNFNASALDVLAGSGYKWLLAGFGNGYIVVKKEVNKRILPKIIGFNSVEYNEQAEPEQSTFIRHFEPGHHDTLNYGSMAFAIDYLQRLGMENVEEHNRKLAIKLRNGLADIGLLDNNILRRKNVSTLLNINGDEKLFNYIKSKNVMAKQRGNGIRLGVHIYNNEKDVNQLLNLLHKR